jgi:DNA-binding transcriptional MerR regulator
VPRAATPAEDDKLYKIGEVCKLADVQPYVLRYWETEFPQLAPNKSGGGQRLYTRREIDTILRIKELLYRDGFTIAGAKKKREEEPAAAAEAGGGQRAAGGGEAAAPAPVRGDVAKALVTVKKELTAILRMLEE